MERLKGRDFLQAALAEHGYSDWYVIEPIPLHSENCLLINPKEKLIAEISIPDDWLYAPHYRSTVEELLVATIRNCTYAIPQAHRGFSRLSRH